MRKESLWFEYLETVEGLIDHETVKAMKQYRHHYFVNCYEHSVFVSYIAFRVARQLGLDEEAAARGGLLHDLYLYDSEDPSQYEGLNALYHPPLALENAEKVTELTDKERNIILSHMWPVAKKRPRSKEAVVVCMADKYCAVLELCKIWHRMKVSRVMQRSL